MDWAPKHLVRNAMNEDFRLTPDVASTMAERVDALYWVLVELAAVVTLILAVLVVYFSIKYRRRRGGHKPVQPPTSLLAEYAWIVIPVPILFGFFLWGASLYSEAQRPPADRMEIDVVAKQWMWKVQHRQGRREIDELHVPTGRPVRLTMISQDVIHSFFVPAFRLKQDVLPGRYTSLWFQATTPGEYHLFCAEYCGTQHSGMVGRIVVMTPAKFAEWLAGHASDESPVAAGRRLFEQMRCDSCHRGGGVDSRGPPLSQLVGRPVPLANGQTVTADEGYLRESILRPAAKVVAGYQPIMPPYEGQISEDGIRQLIAYLRSLSTEGLPSPTVPAGRPAAKPRVGDEPAAAHSPASSEPQRDRGLQSSPRNANEDEQ
jgi:cytochrome c oxidase subunit 2